MWSAIAKLLSGAMEAYNRWAAARERTETENKGRALQNADNLQASVKGDIDAQKTAEDVHDLSDAAADAELLNGPAASPNR